MRRPKHWNTSKIMKDGNKLPLWNSFDWEKVGNCTAVDGLISLPQRMFEREISSCKSPDGLQLASRQTPDLLRLTCADVVLGQSEQYLSIM